MIRVIIMLVFLLTVTHTAAAQLETDKDRWSLIGPVESYRTEVSLVTNVSGQTVEGPRVLMQITSFGKKGNLSGNTFFKPDGSVERKWTFVHIYDAKGRIREKTFLNIAGIVTSRSFYTYDDKGRLTETTFLNANGSINHIRTYDYDDRGNLIRDVYLSPDRSVGSSNVYAYTNKRLTEWVVYNADGTINQTTINTHDARGRETGSTLYEGNGASATSFVHRRDDRGNVIETLQSVKGRLVDRRTFTYEFDSRGNWVKRRFHWEQFRDAEPKVETKVMYRAITYY